MNFMIKKNNGTLLETEVNKRVENKITDFIDAGGTIKDLLSELEYALDQKQADDKLEKLDLNEKEDIQSYSVLTAIADEVANALTKRGLYAKVLPREAVSNEERFKGVFGNRESKLRPGMKLISCRLDFETYKQFEELATVHFTHRQNQLSEMSLAADKIAEEAAKREAEEWPDFLLM